VALLFTYPALLPEAVQDVRLPSDALQDVRNRQAFEALRRAWSGAAPEARAVLDTHAALAVLDTTLRAHVESLLQSLQRGPATPLDAAREDLAKSALRLRQAQLSRTLTDLRFLLQDASEQRDQEETQRLNSLIEQCTREYLEVHRQYYAVTLVGRSRKGPDLS